MDLSLVNEACFDKKNENKVFFDNTSNSMESLPISFSKCESFKEIDFLTKTEDYQTSVKNVQHDFDLIYSSRFNSRQFETIKNHFNTLFTVSYPKEFFDKIQNRIYNTILGYTKSFDVVCFAILNIDNKKKHAEILSFGVLKEFQGKKIGTRLMQKIFEELKILAIKEISLIVQVTNQIAINLYKNFGFEIVKELPDYYYILKGEQRKAYIMQKLVAPEQFWIFKVFSNIAKKFLF